MSDTYLKNNAVIKQADRYAPSNPPAASPCWKCHGTRRIKATRDEVAEKIAVWGEVYGCRWALDLVKGWQKDGCLPCGECE